MSDTLELSVRSRVAYVALNRPDKRNAIDLDLFRALAGVGDRIASEGGVRAVVFHGRGEHFSAGIDLGMLAGADAESIERALQPQSPSPANLFQRAAWVWQELPVPVVCAIRGVAFGAGLQIALGADIRYAEKAARLSIMEVNWGLVPDMAISVTARGLVPIDRLRELAYTGRVLDAADAVSIGLLTAIHEDPLAAAASLAEEIAARSPDAVRGIKKLLSDGVRMATADAFRLEAGLQAGVMGGHNQLEAVQANRERRMPDFTD